MNRLEPAKERVVTPGQFSDGWLMKADQFIRERRFERIRLLRDGNIVVVNPDWTVWNEQLRVEADRGTDPRRGNELARPGRTRPPGKVGQR